MKLVVLAPKSLDDIQRDVEASFGDWREQQPQQDPVSTAKRAKTTSCPAQVSVADCKDFAAMYAALPTMEATLKPFINQPLTAGINSNSAGANFARLHRIVPLKKSNKLVLTWQLPPSLADYRSRPLSYISHLIGHEASGSLLSALKRKGYSNSLSAGLSGSNFDENSMLTLFAVTIVLTDRGLANWMSVAKIAFEYLDLLRRLGPQQSVFEEIKRVSEIKFGRIINFIFRNYTYTYTLVFII
jgi:secreted Zn-dependent insulinase-like peptidase